MFEHSQQGEVIPMSLLCRAATSDIITGYCFGEATSYLDYPDYNEPFFSAVDSNFAMAWPLTYISWLGPVLSVIPPWIMGFVHPGLQPLWDMHKVG
jgi:hypothetical protein